MCNTQRKYKPTANVTRDSMFVRCCCYGCHSVTGSEHDVSLQQRVESKHDLLKLLRQKTMKDEAFLQTKTSSTAPAAAVYFVPGTFQHLHRLGYNKIQCAAAGLSPRWSRPQ